MQQSMEARMAREKEYVKAAKSYVRLNIWFESWCILADPGHVSLRIFDGTTAKLTDISFYPASDKGKDVVWSTGRAVSHSYDKFQVNTLPSITEGGMNIKANGKLPDLVLYFYTLDVQKMLNYWNGRKISSKYCLFASSIFNRSSNVNNCITMALNILRIGGFDHLLGQFSKHQRSFNKIINYLPITTSIIGLILGLMKRKEQPTLSLQFCLKLMGYLGGLYFIGRALGAYLHEMEKLHRQHSGYFITKSAKSIVAALPSVRNLLWRNIPHESKDWIVTTPADFVSKALAAYIVEYRTCSPDDRDNHNGTLEFGKEGVQWYDLMDISAVREASGALDDDADISPNHSTGLAQR